MNMNSSTGLMNIDERSNKSVPALLNETMETLEDLHLSNNDLENAKSKLREKVVFFPDDDKRLLVVLQQMTPEKLTTLLTTTVVSSSETAALKSWIRLQGLVLTKVRVTSFRLAKEIACPPLCDTEPAFLASETWLTSIMQNVTRQFLSKDSHSMRVGAIALARCSRGGKSRSIKEIGYAFKSQNPSAAVVFVSFNDYSPIQRWELDDPVAALCRRFAFAITEVEHSLKTWDTFKSADVPVEDILTWLGGNPCLLLIDELNNIRIDSENAALSDFLKNFISYEFRCFIFTSHVVTFSNQLSSYLDNKSSRTVELYPLPCIDSIAMAKTVLKKDMLSVSNALYYGLIPSMVVVGTYGLPIDKREAAIASCVRDRRIDSNLIKNLMNSFFTGDYLQVPDELHCLMSTVNNSTVQWIPYHMMEVLKRFSNNVHSSVPYFIKEILIAIPDLFEKFKLAKHLDGEGWECLFVATLLTRLVANNKDSSLLPFFENAEVWENYTISYNSYLATGGYDAKTPEEFIGKFLKPHSFPHISVYYPQITDFLLYDVIIATYETAETPPYISGYQIKRGKSIPDHVSKRDIKSFLVRGEAPQKTMDSKYNFISVTKEELKIFFGESGNQWTPEAYDKLLI